MIRIGIHIGDVLKQSDSDLPTGFDVFGEAVNIAARIESLAPKGGVGISERILWDVLNKDEICTSLLGSATMKGISRPLQVFAV